MVTDVGNEPPPVGGGVGDVGVVGVVGVDEPPSPPPPQATARAIIDALANR
jgi:hypothetical protein